MSAGWTTGIRISWAPIAFCSSRMIRDDVRRDALTERQQRVDPRSELADVAGAQEQAVGRHLGLGRIVPQGAHEELAESHRGRIPAEAPAPAPGRRAAGRGPIADQPGSWRRARPGGRTMDQIIVGPIDGPMAVPWATCAFRWSVRRPCRAPGQPKVKQNASMPGSRNSISNVRSTIGAGWRMSW